MIPLLTLVRRCLRTKLCLLYSMILVARTVLAESDFVPSSRVDEGVTLQQQQRPIVNIVGGTPVAVADSGLYSSFAIPKFDTLFCGSILIWEDVLLSAAHCEGGYNFTAQRVMIGGTTLNGTDAIEANVPVRKVIIHPDYTVASIDNEVENDIMLVVLQRTTNPVVPLAKFNTNPSVPPDNAVATVIGHGIDNRTTNTLTYQLNSLNMTIVNFLSCDNAYDVLNEEVHLCATGTRTAIAPCEGDSGGPLLYYNAVQNETTVVGVVSFGVCTFRPNVPSTIFTRISSYTYWILQTICTNSLHPPTMDMCNGKVPLSRLPTSPSSSLAPSISPTITRSPTAAPNVSTDRTCLQSSTNSNNTTATTNECNYFVVFRNRGTYVHRSFLGECLQKCTLFRNLYLRTGWECGRC